MRKNHLPLVFITAVFWFFFFSNKQTRKQPRSTEGSVWTMFFIDRPHCSHVCSKLYCALLEWLQGAHALYLHKWVLLFSCLPQGEDSTIMVQQCKLRRKGRRVRRTIWTKLLSNKSSRLLCLFVGLNKINTPGHWCNLPCPLCTPCVDRRWVGACKSFAWNKANFQGISNCSSWLKAALTHCC